MDYFNPTVRVVRLLHKLCVSQGVGIATLNTAGLINNPVEQCVKPFTERLPYVIVVMVDQPPSPPAPPAVSK